MILFFSLVFFSLFFRSPGNKLSQLSVRHLSPFFFPTVRTGWPPWNCLFSGTFPRLPSVLSFLSLRWPLMNSVFFSKNFLFDGTPSGCKTLLWSRRMFFHEKGFFRTCDWSCPWTFPVTQHVRDTRMFCLYSLAGAEPLRRISGFLLEDSLSFMTFGLLRHFFPFWWIPLRATPSPLC